MLARRSFSPAGRTSDQTIINDKQDAPQFAGLAHQNPDSIIDLDFEVTACKDPSFEADKGRLTDQPNS